MDTSTIHANEIRDILMRAAIEAAQRRTHKPQEPQKPKSTTPIKKKEPEIKIELKSDKPLENHDALKFVDGVHLDVYDYFNISPTKALPDEITRLQKINEWAFNEADREKAIAKLIKLETKLGRNYSSETKLNKIYHHIKLNGITSAKSFR